MDKREIIAQGEWKDGLFYLPKIQLERSLYEAVNDVLERFTGKWNGRKKAHEFQVDAEPLIAHYLETGFLPEKNPLAFFKTPEDAAEKLFSALGIESYDTYDVLEPSAGTGGLLDVLENKDISVKVTAVELDEFRADYLRSKFPTTEVVQADFLNWETDKKFNYIIMNPPFSVDGNADCYIDHIYKAWNLLQETGKLVSVVPIGWLTNSRKKQSAFREFVYENGYYFYLADDAFKKSGTMTKTCVIVLEKYTEKEKVLLLSSSVSGYLNCYVYHVSLYLYNDYKSEQRKVAIIDKLRQGINADQDIIDWYKSGIKMMRDSQEQCIWRDEWFPILIEEFKKGLDEYE